MSTPLKTILRLSLAVCLFSVILGIPSVAVAQNQNGTKTIITMGSAPIEQESENVAVARMAAIENSLVVAVSSVATELLPLESIIQNFQVFNDILYGQTDKFIQGYKVLTEIPTENSYRVMIEATVFTGRLKKLMSDAGMVLDKKALPKILLLVSEKSDKDPMPKYWWGQTSNAADNYSVNALMVALQSNGFTVIDHHRRLKEASIEEVYDKPDLSNQEALDLSYHWQADVVIVGESVSNITANIMGKNVRSFKGMVSARAIRIDTATEIASTTQTIVTTNTDEMAGCRDALIKAGTVSGQELASQIAAFWQKDAQTGNIIEIIIEKTGNLANFVKFRRVLHGLPGVNHLQMKEMTLNQAAIIVDFQGTTEDLARELMLKTLDTIGINIYDISPNYLRIELIPG
jgi:hypothetical protein